MKLETKNIVNLKASIPAATSGAARKPLVPGERVHLHAHELFDEIASAYVWQYQWHLVAAPNTSEARIRYSNLVRATFVPDIAGVYLIQLDATTNDGPVHSIVRVCVSEHATAPVAVAVTNTPYVKVGARVLCNAMASVNPVSGLLKTKWTITAAPLESRATIHHADTCSPAFIPDEPGRYELSLRVKNAAGAIDTDHLVIDVVTPEVFESVSTWKMDGATGVAQQVSNGRNRAAMTEASADGAPSLIDRVLQRLLVNREGGMPSTEPASTF